MSKTFDAAERAIGRRYAAGMFAAGIDSEEAFAERLDIDGKISQHFEIPFQPSFFEAALAEFRRLLDEQEALA